MKILNINMLKGPNYWSIHHKIAELTLSFDKNEELPVKINGFYQDLLKFLPKLREYFDPSNIPERFFGKEKTGALTCHFIEYLICELQSFAGTKCNYTKTIYLQEENNYKIIFAYDGERAAKYTALASVKIAEALLRGEKFNLLEDIENLKKIAQDDHPGLAILSVIQAATEKNIPVKKLEGSIIQLGYGKNQKRIEAGITDQTSYIAVHLVSDRYKTKSLLKSENIPIPEGWLMPDSSELQEIIIHAGFPLIIKSNRFDSERNVTLYINNAEQAQKGFQFVKTICKEVLIERFHPGNSYNLLVLNYKMAAAIRKIPARITGDGILSMHQLIDLINFDPLRRVSPEFNGIDNWELEECLRSQEITLNYVPPQGKTFFIKKIASSKNGGTFQDVTALVHPEISFMAERIARIIGLDICEINFVCDDIAMPLKVNHGVVTEVKISPGLMMNTAHFEGKSGILGEKIVNMLFPGKNNGRIPVIAVTGSNGKTITTRLIAHIAQTAGYNTGSNTTDGVFIGDRLIVEGDCTGVRGENKVLGDKSVDFAIFECPEKSLLSSGLGFDQCDIAIITNVENDHLGSDNINTLEEMTQVKSVVPLMVKKDGITILNADNPYTCGLKNELKSKIAFFSTGLNNCILEHCKEGGTAAIYRNKKILLIKNNVIFFNEDIENIPSTYGGKALFMIEDILAAVLAAYFEGINMEDIRKGLRSFQPSTEKIPGRMNIFHFKNYSILLDYAQNAHAINSVGNWLKQEYACPKSAVITFNEEKRDTGIFNTGISLAGTFDKITLHLQDYPGGQSKNEIIDSLNAGIKSINPDLQAVVFKNELEAVSHCVQTATPGTLIVIFTCEINSSFEIINKIRLKEAEYAIKQFSKIT